MISVVPTVLAANVQDFNQFMEVYKTFAKRIQIDISDGTLAPAQTLPLEQVTIPPDYKGQIDIHLMTKNPSAHIQNLIMLKPTLVILHAECDEDLLPVFKQLSDNNIKVGIATLKTTFPGDIKEYIDAADHALIFGGELGMQGGKADLVQLEKARLIKAMDDKIEIGWDGGANMSNIRAIAHSFIDVINVGSAISQAPDPAQAQKDLEAEAEKTGVLV